jgi:hypothetical protein
VHKLTLLQIRYLIRQHETFHSAQLIKVGRSHRHYRSACPTQVSNAPRLVFVPHKKWQQKSPGPGQGRCDQQLDPGSAQAGIPDRRNQPNDKRKLQNPVSREARLIH